MSDQLSDFQNQLLVILAALLALFIIRYLFLKLIQFFTNRRGASLTIKMIRKHYFPSLYLFLALFLYDVIAFSIELPVYERVFNALSVLSFTWVVAKTIKLVSDVIYQKYSYSENKDNIRERKIHTQALFLEKVLVAVVWIAGITFTLLNAEEVKGIGNKVLASAGIASVVIGFAAQKGIANLIAGFQIAFTQPIRIDDVVIVEGEWGRIEEITMTYVVVRIWDLRRLILPVTYFTQQPFQNWTRDASDLLGVVTFWADYSLNIEKLRQDAKEIVESSDLWNGEYWDLQVVEASDKAIQIRMLLSAPDSSDGWHLRCEIREKMIEHMRRSQPHALPKHRVEQG